MSGIPAPTRIIDAHWHYLHEDFFPEQMWDILSRSLAGHVKGADGAAVDPQEFRRTVFPQLWDTHCDKLVASMDSNGIDVSLVLSDDFGLAFDEPGISMLEQNQILAKLAERHPGRLLPCCVVDPRRKDAIEILEHCVEGLGMRAVGEFHPDTGWSPTSREAYRVFERLQEWKVPMVTHTGMFFPPLKSHYCHPLLLDDVCSDFPELTVVAAHSGNLIWWRTLAHMAAFQPNLYGNLAGLQTLAVRNYPVFCSLLREFIDICGPRKLMWASDDPVYTAVGIPTSRYLELMRQLLTDPAPGTSFTQEEVNLMLGGNAARVFGL